MRRVFSIVAAAAVLSVGQAATAGAPQSAGGGVPAGGGASKGGTAAGGSATGGAAAGAGAPAGGAAAGAGEKVTAEDLFQQGVELIGKGKWADAAAKLEESNRLDRAAGTTINLADCYEHMGKLASAWTLFVEAAAVFGRRTPPDARAETARTRAEALFPKLSRLSIDVPEGVRATKGLVVKRDGEDVGAAQFGTGIAVDPGTHAIEVSAPGKKAWSAEVKVGGDAAKVTLAVPALVDAPVEVGSGGDKGVGGGGDKGPTAEVGWPWQKKAALGVGGVGVAGVIVGAIFGVDAMGKHDQVSKECAPGDPAVCSATGVVIARDMKTAGTVSTIGLAAGGALVAAGVVLWVVAPSPASGGSSDVKGKVGTRAWVAPQVGQRTGVTAGVAW
jgi:hypothetical protein